SSTRLTRSASLASMRPARPSTANRRALPSPMRGASEMGSRALTCPTDTCGSTNEASSDASTTSASAMKCSPPPAHTPLTATIVGSHTSFCSAVIFWFSEILLDLCSRNPPRSPTRLRSIPTQKPRPAPVTMTAPSSGSDFTCAHSLGRPSCMLSLRALRRSGRLRVMMPTLPRFSYSRSSSIPTPLASRQPEDALGDDVALDLFGPAVHARRARPQVARRDLPVLAGHAVGPGGVEHERPERLLGADHEQLVDRRTRPGRLALGPLGEALEQVEPARLHGHVGAGDGLLGSGVTRAGVDELAQFGAVGRDHAELRRPPFVGEHDRRQRPPRALLADAVGHRDARIVEEHLAEAGPAPRLFHRAHSDARRAHVERERGDALVLRRIAIGA